jgi:hypothetical protein
MAVAFLFPLLPYHKWGFKGLAAGLVISMGIQIAIIWGWTQYLKNKSGSVGDLFAVASDSIVILSGIVVIAFIIGTVTFHLAPTNEKHDTNQKHTWGSALLMSIGFSIVAFLTWFGSMKIVIAIQ